MIKIIGSVNFVKVFVAFIKHKQFIIKVKCIILVITKENKQIIMIINELIILKTMIIVVIIIHAYFKLPSLKAIFIIPRPYTLRFSNKKHFWLTLHIFFSKANFPFLRYLISQHFA